MFLWLPLMGYVIYFALKALVSVCAGMFLMPVELVKMLSHRNP
jgi:hypothetical protein